MSKKSLPDLWFTNQLAPRSGLFEAGNLQDAASDSAFVLRLNTLFAARERNLQVKSPADMAAAISSTGRLHQYAELVIFGSWIFEDNMPGLPRKGGPRIDGRSMLQAVAVALIALRLASQPTKVETNRTGRITKNVLAREWTALFKEQLQPSSFDSKLRSMRRILPAYIEYLKSGKMAYAGDLIKKSPQLEKLVTAISTKVAITNADPPKPSAWPGAASSPASPVPAAMSPFEIELCYSSTSREAEYRHPTIGSIPPSKLSYKPVHVSPLPSTNGIRKDRQGRIALEPDLSIRDSYESKALIDRIGILVNTSEVTTWRKIRNAIKKDIGAITFIHDRTILDEEGKGDWRGQLPELDGRKKTGQHFAIMLQEPSPQNMSKILQLINRDHEIEGEISPFLLELSVDFHPRKSSTPEEMVLRREQMVGLLQRHHWASHGLLLDGSQNTAAHADARQIYGSQSNRRFLFSRSKEDSSSSDMQVKIDAVRKRILNAEPGNHLYLDATVYKGIRHSPFLISIQNKIADRRNHGSKEKTDLAANERRARIEVTITGKEALEARGISTIDDLTGRPFRKMSKTLLQFRLGTLDPEQRLLDDAIQQMTTRGTYGMELTERARHQAERRQKRLEDGKMPRDKDREGLGLTDWKEMSSVVGHALDQLGKRWGRFTWQS